MTKRAVTTAGNRRKPPRGVPFEKGDPRINRKGRPRVPKSLIELRETIEEILDEDLETSDGKKVQRLQAMLRIMTSSKHPQDRKAILEFAYGKAPQTIDITSGGKPIETPVFVYLPDNKRASTDAGEKKG